MRDGSAAVAVGGAPAGVEKSGVCLERGDSGVSLRAREGGREGGRSVYFGCSNGTFILFFGGGWGAIEEGSGVVDERGGAFGKLRRMEDFSFCPSFT
jgi:hypothetical protein